MSEHGVFAVHRGIWKHRLFESREPFSRREAWLWLVSEAAYKPRRVKVGPITVDLHRGQLAHSLRFLAEQWRWSLAQVQRYTTRLKTDTMIDTATDTGLTVITICNYDKYQIVGMPRDTAFDTAAGTKPIQQPTQRRRRLRRKESLPSGERRARAKSIPLAEDWRPTAETVAAIGAELALAPDAVAAELPRFRDHYRAAGARREDWDPQFRNWCRRIPALGAAPRPPPKPPDIPVPVDEDARWTRAKARLAKKLGPDVVASWFARVTLAGVEGETVTLAAPTRFVKNWIVAHYVPQLLAAWHAETATIARIEIVWRGDKPNRARAPPSRQLPLMAVAASNDAPREVSEIELSDQQQVSGANLEHDRPAGNARSESVRAK